MPDGGEFIFPALVVGAIVTGQEADEGALVSEQGVALSERIARFWDGEER